MGFVNEGKLESAGAIDIFRVSILERWLKAGYELGNHGYAHLDLHRVPPGEWMEDVVRGEVVTGQLVAAAGGEGRMSVRAASIGVIILIISLVTLPFLRDHSGILPPDQPPKEPQALADAIVETLEQSEAARRRALAGREYVLERHSAARLVRDVDALYRELLAAKKAA